MEYGTEYTQQMINQALRTNDPRRFVPSWDGNGHGTAVASVAAGSILGGGNAFNSPAPNSQIIVVKCKGAKPHLRDYYFASEDDNVYSETDIILALKYIEDYGIAYRRPVIIHFGMGTNLGGHAVGSPFSAYINQAAVRRSRIIVSGGGNQGNAAHHYSGSVRHSINNDIAEDVEIQVKEGTRGFIAELWGSLPNALSISIRSPSGEITNKVNFRTNESRIFSFVYEQTVVQVDTKLVEEQTGVELFVLRFAHPSPGIWVINVEDVYLGSANRGSFNIWIPAAAGDNVAFLNPDPYVTLTGPANTDEIVAVSTYDQYSGSLYGPSGRGYNRKDEIKPDIAAPGVNIDTIIGKMSGSRMASAITAGAAAQFMQWAVVEGHNIYVESRELRSYLSVGARRSVNMSYPNREWGSSVIIVTG